MSNDPTVNPYAPPAEEQRPDDDDDDRPRRRRRGPDFEAERRSVGITVLLSIVTFGLYTIVWLWRRRDFIDSFDTIRRDKLGRIPEMIAVIFGASMVMAMVGGSATPLSGPLSLAQGIATLIACFTVARALRSEIARSGRLIEVSGLLVFFLGVWYLQYKLNEIADTPVHRSKKRKKKAERLEPSDGKQESD